MHAHRASHAPPPQRDPDAPHLVIPTQPPPIPMHRRTASPSPPSPASVLWARCYSQLSNAPTPHALDFEWHAAS